MKIAVLMSVYNGERFLRSQIESILNQIGDFQVELWVRDDGSRDKSREILQEYMDAGRLQWYTGSNLGPAQSFLNLLQRVCGYEYYAFADQDDVWYPDKLARGIERLQETKKPAIYCANAKLVDADLNYLGRNVYRQPPKTDFYSITCGAGLLGCTFVFNRECAVLIQDKPLPEELRMHDCYLGMVCTLHEGEIVYDHEPALQYRQHGNNVVGSSWKKSDAIKNRIRQITQKREQTIDKMAGFICDNYTEVSETKKWKWLKQVSEYRTSFGAAVKLALDRKPSYNGWNKSVTIRMAILLKNR